MFYLRLLFKNGETANIVFLVASLLVRLLLIMTSSRYFMISCPRGAPLRAQGILGTVEKINETTNVNIVFLVS